MYGFPFTQPFPDLPNINCLIIVGANPIVSKWSFLQVPNPSKHLKEMKARGAKLYVVDPRYTETAKIAGGHVVINPGTDVFFYLSFLNELIRINGIDQDLINKHTEGFEELVELYAKKIGKTQGRVAVKDMKSRWGSCSSEKYISLSWRLAFAPFEVAHYVVAHEVAHMKHMNHSLKFWKQVELLYPNYKKHRGWLKQNGQNLHAYV